MYKFKRTERNREKASDFETYSMLYLLGIHKDKNKIEFILVDSFNDVTGSNENVSQLWDIQSKGYKSNTPYKIGEFLITLFENSLTKYPFVCYILFLETIDKKYLKSNQNNVLKINNFKKESKDRIYEGLFNKFISSHKKATQLPSVRQYDDFLKRVFFVIKKESKPEYVRNLIRFKNIKLIKDELFV